METNNEYENLTLGELWDLLESKEKELEEQNTAPVKLLHPGGLNDIPISNVPALGNRGDER